MRRTHWIALAGLIGLLTTGVALAQTSDIVECLNRPPSRLHTRLMAAVTPGTPPVNLRQEPSFGGNRIGTLTSGAPFRVIDGPACADGVIWWKVVTEDGTTGWAAESQGNQIYLMPYVPEPIATVESGQVNVQHKGVYFTLDSALASGVAVKDLPETVPNPDGEGFPQFSAPAGVEYLFFDGSESSVFPRSTLDIYPAKRFAQIYAPNGEKIDALKALIADESASVDSEIPEVPGHNAAQMIRAAIRYLDLPDGGKGVRILTYYAQNRYPATNELLYYEFRGFDSAGFNYIHFQYAVRASILPETAVSQAFWNEADFDTYRANISRLLSELPIDQFTPSLDALDALAQSIKVGNG